MYWHNTNGGEKVAVKVFHDTELRTLARIDREVAVLKKLMVVENRHIQQLYTPLANLATYAVISPYYGDPLSFLQKGSVYLIDYIIQVCDALASLQQIKYCHGDLHPGNIIINASTNHVTLIDWELAIGHNTVSRNVTGALAFASNRILGQLPGITGYKHLFHDDLESLAYLSMSNIVRDKGDIRSEHMRDFT